MSIANDAWIRKMSLEHGMIVPFEEKLVAKGKISYGLSSYGYDVRVGRHFKIFHNLNSTLVDPKAFDARSFADHVGDECIIPPNSFVLAETVERFKIPRDVLCVCLGKCVTGDTRVVDADTGDFLPIREFAGRRRTVGLSGWAAKTQRVSDFLPQGVRPVFELCTRSGLSIRTTATHPFRTLSGWEPLSSLRPGERIAAAREVPVFGNTHLSPGEADRLGERAAHDGTIPGAIFRAPRVDAAAFLRSFFCAAFAPPDGMGPRVPGRSRRAATDLHHLLLRFGIASTLSKGSHPGEVVLRISEPGSLLRLDVADHRGERARRGSRTPPGPARAFSKADVVYAAAGTATVAVAEDEAFLGPDACAWETVESITPAGEEEVFDLSVPGAANFLANDLFVHNSTYARCGIIVNVTPLEPEWEGVVTIEISNTTPLPAKIYANEGISQILFFRAAPDGICQTSYKDRGGKYQNQAGLTLPKILA